jgi:enterochelin esterase-like enzyme
LATLALYAPAAAASTAQAPTPVVTSTRLAGTLQDAQFFSPILMRSVPYRIYLPPDYATSGRTYPVLYLLHGVGGDYTEWTTNHLPERVDDLIQRGAIQPMVVVMPDAKGRTYWANWPDNGPRYADYLAVDVVREIDTHYRTQWKASSRAIGGLSMGGLGALHTALHHPDIFSVVGGHSPSIRVEPDPRMAPNLPGASFDEFNPVWLMQYRWRPGPPLLMWLDVGLDDPYHWNVEKLRDLVVLDPGIQLSWHETAGGHDGAYWSAHLNEYLTFYSDALRLVSNPPPAPLPTMPASAPSPAPAAPTPAVTPSSITPPPPSATAPSSVPPPPAIVAPPVVDPGSTDVPAPNPAAGG